MNKLQIHCSDIYEEWFLHELSLLPFNSGQRTEDGRGQREMKRNRMEIPMGVSLSPDADFSPFGSYPEPDANILITIPLTGEQCQQN